MECNLLFVHGSAIGYGRYGVHLAENLQRLGVDIYDHLPGTEQDPTQEHLNLGRQSKVCNVVCWVSVPSHARGWWKGQVPVVSTMWEASQLPESFRETLHEFETVIVPSHQNMELFSRYHSNVKYVPLGIDPAVWKPTKRKPPEQHFNFLIGGSGARKGTDLAHKAFRKVFAEGSWGDGPIPKLIMKNPRGESFYGDRIEMITGRISDEAEVSLYEQAHCYLQPSRGEGFGLQPLQAIAQGIPTILTDAHGQADFAHLGLGIKASMAKSAYFIYGDAGDWWEPDFDELCDQMRWVYDHYEQALDQAHKNAHTAVKKWTWENTARAFIEAIGADKLSSPPSVTDWYAPQVHRYKLITNRDWAADIAGVSYQFKRGETYFELADVKRILFEAGLLDPACLDNGQGLTDSQVQSLGSYTAAHSWCALCGQKLGSHPTRADEIEGELIANHG